MANLEGICEDNLVRHVAAGNVFEVSVFIRIGFVLVVLRGTPPYETSGTLFGVKWIQMVTLFCTQLRFYDVQGLLNHPKLLNAMCAGQLGLS